VTQPEASSDRECIGEAADRHDRVAPTIGKWVTACFPGGTSASEAQIHELVQEAVASARSDYGVEAALAWADGYAFPPQVVESDTASLAAAGFDFEVMVRERLESLAADRPSMSRVNRLRANNPERELLLDLVLGMKVHVPEGFQPNGHGPRTELRDIYVDVAPAVNKMYGATLADRLAFLLPLDLALQHVPNLHLSKGHRGPKKGKASG
jgi:hypothetical protein